MTHDWRGQLISHIAEHAAENGIWIDIMNGVADHLHALISLSSVQSISQIMQIMKGESAHWVNQQGFIRDHFAWQEEYYAVSVSESGIDGVRWYIRIQEEHHRKRSFDEECEDLARQYGFHVPRSRRKRSHGAVPD